MAASVCQPENLQPHFSASTGSVGENNGASSQLADVGLLDDQRDPDVDDDQTSSDSLFGTNQTPGDVNNSRDDDDDDDDDYDDNETDEDEREGEVLHENTPEYKTETVKAADVSGNFHADCEVLTVPASGVVVDDDDDDDDDSSSSTRSSKDSDASKSTVKSLPTLINPPEGFDDSSGAESVSGNACDLSQTSVGNADEPLTGNPVSCSISNTNELPPPNNFPPRDHHAGTERRHQDVHGRWKSEPDLSRRKQPRDRFPPHLDPALKQHFETLKQRILSAKPIAPLWSEDRIWAEVEAMLERERRKLGKFSFQKSCWSLSAIEVDGEFFSLEPTTSASSPTEDKEPTADENADKAGCDGVNGANESPTEQQHFAEEVRPELHTDHFIHESVGALDLPQWYHTVDPEELFGLKHTKSLSLQSLTDQKSVDQRPPIPTNVSQNSSRKRHKSCFEYGQSSAFSRSNPNLTTFELPSERLRKKPPPYRKMKTDSFEDIMKSTPSVSADEQPVVVSQFQSRRHRSLDLSYVMSERPLVKVDQLENLDVVKTERFELVTSLPVDTAMDLSVKTDDRPTSQEACCAPTATANAMETNDGTKSDPSTGNKANYVLTSTDDEPFINFKYIDEDGTGLDHAVTPCADTEQKPAAEDVQSPCVNDGLLSCESDDGQEKQIADEGRTILDTDENGNFIKSPFVVPPEPINGHDVSVHEELANPGDMSPPEAPTTDPPTKIVLVNIGDDLCANQRSGLHRQTNVDSDSTTTCSNGEDAENSEDNTEENNDLANEIQAESVTTPNIQETFPDRHENDCQPTAILTPSVKMTHIGHYSCEGRGILFLHYKHNIKSINDALPHANTERERKYLVDVVRNDVSDAVTKKPEDVVAKKAVASRKMPASDLQEKNRVTGPEIKPPFDRRSEVPNPLLNANVPPSSIEIPKATHRPSRRSRPPQEGNQLASVMPTLQQTQPFAGASRKGPPPSLLKKPQTPQLWAFPDKLQDTDTDDQSSTAVNGVVSRQEGRRKAQPATGHVTSPATSMKPTRVRGRVPDKTAAKNSNTTVSTDDVRGLNDATESRPRRQEGRRRTQSLSLPATSAVDAPVTTDNNETASPDTAVNTAVDGGDSTESNPVKPPPPSANWKRTLSKRLGIRGSNKVNDSNPDSGNPSAVPAADADLPTTAPQPIERGRSFRRSLSASVGNLHNPFDRILSKKPRNQSTDATDHANHVEEPPPAVLPPSEVNTNSPAADGEAAARKPPPSSSIRRTLAQPLEPIRRLIRAASVDRSNKAERRQSVDGDNVAPVTVAATDDSAVPAPTSSTRPDSVPAAAAAPAADEGQRKPKSRSFLDAAFRRNDSSRKATSTRRRRPQSETDNADQTMDTTAGSAAANVMTTV